MIFILTGIRVSVGFFGVTRTEEWFSLVSLFWVSSRAEDSKGKIAEMELPQGAMTAMKNAATSLSDSFCQIPSTFDIKKP